MIPARTRVVVSPPLTVFEWEVLRPDRFSDPRAFRELHAWALTDEGQRVLEAGSGRIRVLNHVGVVMTRSGFVLEILPKTERAGDVEGSRRLLLAMLARAGSLPSWEGPSAPADVACLPLSEALARLFRLELVHLAKRGLVSSYATNEADLGTIRGKLRIGEFARKGTRIDRLPCAFDERGTATTENRILATALSACESLSWGVLGPSRRLMLVEAFEDIEPYGSAHEALQALKDVVLDRANKGYRTALSLSRLILTGLDVAGTWAKEIRFGLFFPMEVVFERFVLAALRDLENEGLLSSVAYQAGPHWLLTRDDEGTSRRSFNLRPDITVMTRDGRRIILDAKWKLLDDRAEDGKHGISQADLYQLLSYATIYSAAGQSVSQLVLVYPSWDGFDRQIDYRYSNVAGTPLAIAAMPLEGECKGFRRVLS